MLLNNKLFCTEVREFNEIDILYYITAELGRFSAVDAIMCSAQLPGHKIASALYLNGGVILPVVFIIMELVLLKQHNQVSWHIIM
jgi:hypothetical protein